MNSHDSWFPMIVAAVVAWWVVVIACGSVLHATSRPVTLEVTPMSRRSTWWSRAMAAVWRLLSWLAFLAALDALSIRAARRAGRLERRGRPRARPAAAPGASWRDQDPTLASSPCSPWARTLPPSAPRPATPEDEATRRWERTLPWGTPSPLLTREGIGRPYPFVPLSEQPPSSAPPYRPAVRPPPPIPDVPRTTYRTAGDPPRKAKPVPLPDEPMSVRK